LHLVYFFTSLLVVLGLGGAVDRLRGRAGLVAGVGFVALSAFVAISELGHSVLEATLIAVLRDNPTTTNLVTDDSWLAQSLFSGTFGMMMLVGMVMLVAGLLLVSIGTLIEGTYPRWPAILLLAMAPTPFLPFTQGPIAPALMYLALAGFGYAMITGAGPESLPLRKRRPSSSSAASQLAN
jgi:hypothetical protein